MSTWATCAHDQHGTFIINGTERVIVSQMPSPGAVLRPRQGQDAFERQLLFAARVIRIAA